MPKRKSSNSPAGIGDILFLGFAALIAAAIAHPFILSAILIIAAIALIRRFRTSVYDDCDSLPMFKDPPKRYIDPPSHPPGHHSPHQDSGCEIIATVRDSSGRTRRYYSDSSYRRTPHCDAVREKWSTLTNRHWVLLRQIDKSYSAILNKNKESYFTPEMEVVIDLCQQDICLADQFKSYLDEMSTAEIADHVPRSQISSKTRRYHSFQRLAIIYERRRDFESAIEVCNEAISLGFVDEDGGKTVYDRLARLCKRAGITFTESDVSGYDPFSAAE